MIRLILHVILVAGVGGLRPAGAIAEEKPSEFSPEQATFFREHVVDILKQNCIKCHSGAEPEGGLNLTERLLILKGGESGAALVPGNSADSLMIHAVAQVRDDLKMPKKGAPLSAEQIGLLRARTGDLKAQWFLVSS